MHGHPTILATWELHADKGNAEGVALSSLKVLIKNRDMIKFVIEPRFNAGEKHFAANERGLKSI